MILHAATFNSSGYGKVARTVAEIFPHARLLCKDGLPDNLKAREVNGNTTKSTMSITPPHWLAESPVMQTVWESSLLPAECVKILNRKKLIIVPCEQNRQAFKASGVKTKIAIVHQGVTPQYHIMPPHKPFTFLFIGADSGIPQRKRVQDIVDTFSSTFHKQTDVRLVVKQSATCQRAVSFDSRVSIITDELTEAQMKDLYLSAHVGVFLSGQEGWGYPHIQLMAYGRPIISPFYMGPAEYLDNTNAFAVEFSIRKTPKLFYRELGLCAWASLTHFSKQLLYAYNNIDDVVLKGIHAYRTTLGFTYNRMRAEMHKLLNYVES